MDLLISDANILIDMVDGQLLEAMFTLPYRFVTPDILFEEELRERHDDLLAMGLQLGELTAATMANMTALAECYRKASRNQLLNDHVLDGLSATPLRPAVRDYCAAGAARYSFDLTRPDNATAQ